MLPRKTATHAAMVSEMDAAIGKLIDELDAEGMAPDTLIFSVTIMFSLTEHRLLPGFAFRLINGLESIFGKPIPGRFLEFMRTICMTAQPIVLARWQSSAWAAFVPAIINWPGKLQTQTRRPPARHRFVGDPDGRGDRRRKNRSID